IQSLWHARRPARDARAITDGRWGAPRGAPARPESRARAPGGNGASGPLHARRDHSRHQPVGADCGEPRLRPDSPRSPPRSGHGAVPRRTPAFLHGVQRPVRFRRRHPRRLVEHVPRGGRPARRDGRPTDDADTGGSGADGPAGAGRRGAARPAPSGPRTRPPVCGGGRGGARGAVDPGHGVVKALAPNLKGWNEVPVASLLRRAVGAPVIVDNDVNLAILGERWRGVARGHDTCAFITVGTGIGAGIIVKGELHHGHHFQAGEIALMCMGPQFVDSDFGARGCLETLVGLKALEARWSRHASSEGEPGAKGLIDAAQAGDRKARSILDETVTLIGIAAANLTLTLDPSLIVLGGAFIAQAPHTIDEIRRIVARVVLTPSGIMQSTLGESAPLWGSVLLAMSAARQRLRAQLKNGRSSSGSSPCST